MGAGEGLSPALAEALADVARLTADLHAPGNMLAALDAVESIRTRLLIRACHTTNGSGGHQKRDVADEIVGVDEAARIAHHSVSWMRKNGDTLPGFWQPRGKGTAVGWKRAELVAWAKGSC